MKLWAYFGREFYQVRQYFFKKKCKIKKGSICHLAHMALKLWNNRSVQGEAREWAKAPFPSDARPRSIIANGGPSSHRLQGRSSCGRMNLGWRMAKRGHDVIPHLLASHQHSISLPPSLHLSSRTGLQTKEMIKRKDNSQMHLLEIVWGPHIKTSFNGYDCLKHHHPWVLKLHPQSSLCAGRGAFADK